jgi:hypothetical protein
MKELKIYDINMGSYMGHYVLAHSKEEAIQLLAADDNMSVEDLHYKSIEEIIIDKPKIFAGYDG